MNSSNIYKTISTVKDMETLATGDAAKIIKRTKNKVKAKVLYTVLNKIGFWSR